VRFAVEEGTAGVHDEGKGSFVAVAAAGVHGAYWENGGRETAVEESAGVEGCVVDAVQEGHMEACHWVRRSEVGDTGIVILEMRVLGTETVMGAGLTETVCWEDRVQGEERARCLDRARHCRSRGAGAVVIALVVVVVVVVVVAAAVAA